MRTRWKKLLVGTQTLSQKNHRKERRSQRNENCPLLSAEIDGKRVAEPISLSEQAGSYCSISAAISGSSTYVHCAAQYWAARERDEASSSPAMPKSNDNASDSTPGTHGRAVAAVDAAYLIRLLPVSAAQRWPCYRPQCQRPLYDSGWGWSASFSPAMPQVNRNFNIII